MEQGGGGARRQRRRYGFSIIELLVAIIIIGILVAVLIPVVANRTEQARLSRAQADLERLANAMETAALDTGYYVRLFALNDVLRGDGIPFNRGQLPNNDRVDGLTDYSVAQPFYNFPDQNSLFIDMETGLFASLNRTNFINRLLSTESFYDGGVNWNGPYINWYKDNNLVNGLLAPDGIPDDPWGNNYLFFTKEGLLLEPTGIFVTGVSEDGNGGLIQGGTYDTVVFDRPTILSLGPNGLPGDGTNTGLEGPFGRGDDLARPFGR